MLYIQNRADSTLGVIEDFYNDTHQMILSSGVSSYTFTVAKNIEDAEYLVEGNYIVVTDDVGLGWKFTIMNTSQTHTEITVYCEDIGLELVNKVMDAWSEPSSKQPASYYINKAIKDTKWKIGLNQIGNLSRTLKWEGRDTSLNRLLSICTEFDHAEIEFRVRFRNLQVTDYLINIYKKRGSNRSDIQLEYGDTVNDITKTSSIEELATALMGVGSDKELPENTPAEAIPDKTTFKDLTYDDGFLFTKAGDKFLRARVANQQFNLKEGYIEDFYEYDTADPQELLNRTIAQLKERSEIKVNYEVSVAKFEKTLQLGDTITIIDHDYKPELLLRGRVLEMDKSYTDPSKNTLVLGNFLILYSNINDRLTNLQNQIKNMKLDSNYMWLRYAIDDKGNGMSATPTAETKYFAMLVNKKTGIPSDNPADYAGHWKLIQGADGKNGIPGKPGADGKTPYFHTAWATSADGKNGFSITDSANKTYLGTYTDFTKPDSTDTTKYAWSLIKGRDGTNGTPGKPGVDGKTPYFHTAWADSKDGKTNFNLSDATNRGYLGTYTDFEQADSKDPTKYIWTELVGALSIGGRNYLADTSTSWQTQGSGGTNQTSSLKWLFTFGTIKQAPFNDGDYVTLSFDYTNVGTGAYGTILPQLNNTPWGQLGGGDAMKDNGHAVRTVQWKSGWNTSGTATGIQIRIDNVATTRTVTVYDMQFERGNKATDHKVAPEDTQGQIDKVNNGLADTNSKIAAVTKVDSQATAPTNPKKGDQWWVLDANGKTTGLKIWTGSVWKDSIIQQSAMNISTLNGNVINGATINSSNFNVSYDETAASSGRLVGPYFKGTQIIKGGSYLSDYTIKGTTQTGFNHITPDGITNRMNDDNGQMINQTTLGRGYLILSEKGKTGVITGDLNAQDSYRNSTDSVAWLGGWGDWGNGKGLIHVVRNGRLVTLSGYPHHNNTTTLGNIFQLPAWAKPAEGVNIGAVCYNGSVMNPTACRLFISDNGLVNISNAQKGGWVVIGTSYVGQDM